MVSRIKKLIELQGVSVRAFAIACEINSPTLDRQLKGRMALSLDTVNKILAANPNLSAEWLMRGEGSMTKSEMLMQSSDRVNKLISTIGELQSIIEEKQSIINALQAENEKLKKQIK